MILLMANTACGFLFAAAEINLDRGNVSDPTIVPWTTSFLSLTVVQNVLCTCKFSCHSQSGNELIRI
jgi:hypothetical protein